MYIYLLFRLLSVFFQEKNKDVIILKLIIGGFENDD